MKIYATFVEHDRAEREKNIAWLRGKGFEPREFGQDNVEIRAEGNAPEIREIAGYIMKKTFHSVNLST